MILICFVFSFILSEITLIDVYSERSKTVDLASVKATGFIDPNSQFLTAPSIEREQRLADAGWFSVARQEKEEMPPDGEGTEIWAVFGQRLPHESILIRFPGEPTYRYEGERIEVSYRQGETFFFFSAETPPHPSTLSDQKNVYKEGDLWVQERRIATKYTIFCLKISSSMPLQEDADRFLSSFQCELTDGKDHKFGALSSRERNRSHTQT